MMEASVIMFLIGLMLGSVIVGCIAAKAVDKMRHALRAKNSIIAELRRQR